MSYFATITNTFNQNIFNKVFDYSFIVANEYLEKLNMLKELNHN